MNDHLFNLIVTLVIFHYRTLNTAKYVGVLMYQNYEQLKIDYKLKYPNLDDFIVYFISYVVLA